MSHSFVSDIFNVQKGERLKTGLLFTWFFLFICVYYILRPIRRGLVLEGLGNDNMPFVYMGTALVTGVVVWIYSKFAHLPRKPLISSIYGIFMVNLLLWWQAFQFESNITSGLFWVWLDVFSIMGVTLFWMYANDIFDSSAAKRLFGIIAGGGGLGAVLGSSITAGLVQALGTTNMLLVAAGLVGVTLGIFLYMESVFARANLIDGAGKKKEKDKKELETKSFVQIFAHIGANKFLLFLTLVVCFERMTPDFVQFLYHEVLTGMAKGSAAIAAVDANLERWRGICEFGIEMFVVAAVIKRFGSGFSLASSGLAICGSLIAFAILANPLIVIAIFHADEAIRHSWFKAAKELTYTVTNRQVLYMIKPVIEMFCYRFSRGLAGVAIYLVNTVFGWGVNGIMVTGGLCAAAWAFCAWKLNDEYRRLEVKTQIEKAFQEPPDTLPAAEKIRAEKEKEAGSV